MNAMKDEAEHQPSRTTKPNFQFQKLQQGQQEATPTEKRFVKALHWMRCPKCGQALTTERHSGVDIDVCPDCGESCLEPAALEAIVAPENEFLRSCLRHLHRH